MLVEEEVGVVMAAMGEVRERRWEAEGGLAWGVEPRELVLTVVEVAIVLG